MTNTITHPETHGTQNGTMEPNKDPDSEVPERARGPRRYPAQCKVKILAEYDSLPRSEKGALLRREGLYSSLITMWRSQRDTGAVEALPKTSH